MKSGAGGAVVGPEELMLGASGEREGEPNVSRTLVFSDPSVSLSSSASDDDGDGDICPPAATFTRPRPAPLLLFRFFLPSTYSTPNNMSSTLLSSPTPLPPAVVPLSCLRISRCSVLFHRFLMALSVLPGSRAAMAAHLLPNSLCASTMILSSSSVHASFLMSGLR